MGPLGSTSDTTSDPAKQTTTTLATLLDNDLVLRQLAPYLPVCAKHALGASSKKLFQSIYNGREAFRYLDLSPVKSAVLPFDGPLDSGGVSWRAERMDESLTEDEFYSGPLRGIFSKLERRNMLRTVHTMVLDGLSVTADLVREIIAEDRFNVRILSIREVKHLNERKLMQVLRYAVRPTREEGSPRLKGLYVFGPRDPVPVLEEDEYPKRRRPGSSRSSSRSNGAKIGAEWNQKSSEALNTALARTDNKWYQSAGRIFTKRPSVEWAEIVKACEGIIAFDAVLCRGPRHDITKAVHHPRTTDPAQFNPNSFLGPSIATVALGPAGCETCHSCPEGPALLGQSAASHFPLLSPPPLHSSTVRAAQTPHTTDGGRAPPLIIRCEDCLKGRWCERCHKWWDETCYTGSAIAQRTSLQLTEFVEEVHGAIEEKKIKVIGVRRDCFGCGHTCAECKEVYIRRCQTCRNEYCIEDNDASSSTRCDWCNYTSRRTVEMY